MASELAAAYITLIPSLKGAQAKIKSELSGIDVSGIGTSMGNTLGSSISSGVKTASNVILGSLGSIGGALGSMAASGGMARALNIEQAQTMFKGLELDWESFEQTINDAVTGTAFGMDEAALVAASLAASGVQAGDQMEQALNTATGMAATFGRDLGDIGDIFQKVAAQGKMSGDNLFQLSTRGIPALQLLSEHLQVSAEEAKQFVSEGKVDFQTFMAAMDKFNGKAQGANDTFAGSMKNMRAALSRLGQKFATPFTKAMIPVFNGIKDSINAVSNCLEPLVAGFTSLVNVLSGGVSNKLKSFSDGIKNALKALGAMDENGKAIAGVLTPLGALRAAMSGFRSAFGNIGGTIAAIVAGIVGVGMVFGALSSVFAILPGIGGLLGMFSGGAGVVSLFGGALGVIPGILGAILGPAGAVLAIVTALGAGFVAAYAKIGKFRVEINSIIPPSGRIRDLFENLNYAIADYSSSLREGHSKIKAFSNAWITFSENAQIMKPFNLASRAINSFRYHLANSDSTMEAFVKTWGIFGGNVDFTGPFKTVSRTIKRFKYDITSGMGIMDSLGNAWSGLNVELMRYPFLKGIVDGAVDFVTSVKNIVMPILTGIKDGVFGFAESFMGAFEGDTTGLASVVSAIASIGSPLGMIRTLVSTLGDDLQRIADFLGPKIAPALSALGSVLGSAFNAILSVISYISNNPALQTFLSHLVGIGLAAKLLAPAFGGFIGIVGGALSGAFNGINGLILAAAGKLTFFTSVLNGSAISSAAAGFAGNMTRLKASIAGFGKALSGALLSPVGIAIMVIAALAAAIAYLWNTNEDFRNQLTTIGHDLMDSLAPAIEEIGSSVMSIVDSVLPVLTSAIEILIPAIKTIIDVVLRIVAVVVPIVAKIAAAVIPVIAKIIAAVVSVVEYIVTAVMPIVETIFNLISENMPQIQAVIMAAMDVIESVITTVWPFIETVIDAAVTNIMNVIDIILAIIRGDWEGAWNGVQTYASDAWEGIKNVVKAGCDMVTSFIGEIPGKILSFFSNAGDLLWSAGSAILNGLWSGLKSAWRSVSNWLSGLAGKIAKLKGPLPYDRRVLIPNGKALMSGLNKGLNVGFGNVIKNVSSMATSIDKTFTGQLKKSSIPQAMESLVKKTTSKASAFSPVFTPQIAEPAYAGGGLYSAIKDSDLLASKETNYNNYTFGLELKTDHEIEIGEQIVDLFDQLRRLKKA